MDVCMYVLDKSGIFSCIYVYIILHGTFRFTVGQLMITLLWSKSVFNGLFSGSETEFHKCVTVFLDLLKGCTRGCLYCMFYAFHYFPGLRKDAVHYIRLQSGTGALHVPLARHTAVLAPVKMYLCKATTQLDSS